MLHSLYLENKPSIPVELNLTIFLDWHLSKCWWQR